MILETRALTRRYGPAVVVDSLTLSVEAGSVFGLLGPNGAGKSTTIKMLTTLLPPTSGEATVVGYDLNREAAAIREVIGYVPQQVSADGTLTGYENLHVFARLYRIPHAQAQARIDDALALMDLTEAAGKLVRTYSGGMLRRLEIAQSMLHRPRLLFLDEPTVGLDPLAREAVWHHIEQMRHLYGTSIFMTTHYMDEVERLCTDMAIMHRGRLAALGTPDALKRSLGTPNATLDDVFAHYAGDADPAGLADGNRYGTGTAARRALRGRM